MSTLSTAKTKLLFITAGNIVNRDLIALFEQNWQQVHPLLEQFKIIEMNQFEVTVHF